MAFLKITSKRDRESGSGITRITGQVTEILYRNAPPRPQTQVSRSMMCCGGRCPVTPLSDGSHRSIFPRLEFNLRHPRPRVTQASSIRAYLLRRENRLMPLRHCISYRRRRMSVKSTTVPPQTFRTVWSNLAVGSCFVLCRTRHFPA